jgi:FkbM family methyltransferase
MKAKPTTGSTPRTLQHMRLVNVKRELATFPAVEIDVDGRTIRYSAAEGSKHLVARVTTLFAKEPTTMPYLETFAKDDVFLDIGANVGMYTVYAAMMTGCRVVAIEPEALNFAELNKNIYLNGLNDRVTAYCAAAGTQLEVGKLLLGAFAVGFSHHDYGESSWRKDMKWSPEVTVARDQRITQGSISVSIDELVASGAIPQPHHVKIDVDGHEPRVVAGAAKTFANSVLKTVLVEIDFGSPACQQIVDTMVANGWQYSMDQLVTNRHHVMKPERIAQLREIRKDGFNYIFYRDPAYGELFRDFLARYEPPLDEHGKLKRPPKVEQSAWRRLLEFLS